MARSFRSRYVVDPRIKNAKRVKAINFAYATLKCWAVALAEGPDRRPVIARDLAQHARELIAAFGVRA